MEKAPREDRADALPCEDSRQKRPPFKGIRRRKWGSWGSEIRMLKSRAKIWLGSYKTSDQAARAYDAAVYCLRINFNFPNSVPSIPLAFSLTPRQIQLAAARYARGELPSTSPSSQNNNNNNNNGVSVASSSCSSLVLLRSGQIGPKSSVEVFPLQQQADFWDSLFDSRGCHNFQNFPSIDDTSTLDFGPTWPEEQQDAYISLDLWNF